MAKKKTIELRSAGADVPSGDVNITYNGVRIAGFSEDTDATLKTGMKRVEHDINIEYTKPEENVSYIPFNISDTAETVHDFNDGSDRPSHVLLASADGNPIVYTDTSIAPIGVIPGYDSRTQHYTFNLGIHCNTDSLNVVINNQTLTWDSEAWDYVYTYDSATYEPVTISITDKENGEK